MERCGSGSKSRAALRISGHHGLPATDLASRASGLEPLARALDDQFADEPGERREDVEDQPAAGGRSVEGFVQ